VFLAGEGRTELGSWCDRGAYRAPHRRGAIEVLLEKANAEADIVGAVVWSKIPKLRAGGHATAEMRNIGGAALQAREAGAEVLVFSRDEDGDADRAAEIHKGIQRLVEEGHPVRVAGGLAVRRINDWVRALAGKELAAADELIEAIDACEVAALTHATTQSPSLRAWLDSIRQAWER
jgi:hypothetical protein